MKKITVLQGMLCVILCILCMIIENKCIDVHTLKTPERQVKKKVRVLLKKEAEEEQEYRGKIKVKRTSDGTERINEVSLEEYLYGVVGSEMPSSYPEEALKAQAVCARTYALGRMQNPVSSRYDLDDTTAFQVYSPQNESQSVRDAVDATKGELLMYGNDLAETFFFSTSCGLTTDADAFGQSGNDYPYLAPKLLGADMREYDYRKEAAFAEFIKSGGENAWEKNEKWFRWQVQIFPERISVKGLEKGKVKEIRVLERGDGGIVERIGVSDGKNMVEIKGEYEVRCLLAQAADTILQNDGSTTECAALLPSAWFIIEEEADGTFFLSGGGYGHGVGMAQNAAREMALQGMDYQQILSFFFEGTELLTE